MMDSTAAEGSLAYGGNMTSVPSKPGLLLRFVEASRWANLLATTALFDSHSVVCMTFDLYLCLVYYKTLKK